MSKELNYIEEAQRTNTGGFYGDSVSQKQMLEGVGRCVNLLSLLDDTKKQVFYGRGLTDGEGHRTYWPIGGNLEELVEDRKQIEFVHGVVGIATESGELLELLQNFLNPAISQEIDIANLKEELGDLFWYIALLANAFGFTFEEIQQTNIEKLRQRFPEKFTEELAINRNLEAERKILEKGVDSEV